MGFGGSDSGYQPDKKGYQNRFTREWVDQAQGILQGQYPQYAEGLPGQEQDAIDRARQFYQGAQGGMGDAQGVFNSWMSGGGVDPTVAQFGNQLLGGQMANPATANAAYWANPDNINPYLDQVYDTGARALEDSYVDTLNRVRTNAGMQGLRGSSAMGQQIDQADEGLARGLADLSSDVYGRGYDTAANRALSATGLQGQFANADLNNQMLGAQLLDTGSQRQFQAASMMPQFAQGAGGVFGNELGLNDYAYNAQFRPIDRAQQISGSFSPAYTGGGGGSGSLLGNVAGGGIGGAMMGMAVPGMSTPAILGLAGLGAAGGLFG